MRWVTLVAGNASEAETKPGELQQPGHGTAPAGPLLPAGVTRHLNGMRERTGARLRPAHEIHLSSFGMVLTSQSSCRTSWLTAPKKICAASAAVAVRRFDGNAARQRRTE